MPAGKYWVGDLCYVMHKEWTEVCDKTIVDHRCLSGKFKLDSGVEFALLHTAWGDGTYQDQEGRDYPVDAGLIGCIRVEDIQADDRNWEKGGHVVEFEYAFDVYDDEGVLHFGRVVIDTAGSEEDEDDYYDEPDVDEQTEWADFDPDC